MKTIAILGASGRIGREVARMFSRYGPDLELKGSYYKHKPSFDGIDAQKVNIENEGDILRFCQSCDAVIDCTGPSSKFGLATSRLLAQIDIPFISVGHEYCPQSKNQTFQAGALPGILSGAFLLLDPQYSNVEIAYKFAGSLTPNAAYDVITASSYAPPISNDGAEPNMLSQFRSESIPYNDIAISRLANKAGVSVAAFSIWPKEIRTPLASSKKLNAMRASFAVSAFSHLDSSPTKSTNIYLAGSSRDGEISKKVISVPSLNLLSAASAWLAFRHDLYECRDSALPLAILQSKNPKLYIEEAVALVGGKVDEVATTSSPFSSVEEGTI